MSEPLALCLIAVAANLVGMMVIYSVMAQALTRSAWRGRGNLTVVATIVVAQLFWIAPALGIAARNADSSIPYALWFGDWLVCGFAIVLLWKTATSIPPQLEDSARLDGLGSSGVWSHVVFPFMKRDLALIALFTIMATLLPGWAFINLPEAGNVIVLYQKTATPVEHFIWMTAASLIGALPLIAIFLLTKRPPAVR